MKKTICGILAVLFLILPLSGCGSWKDKFEISNVIEGIDRTSIMGEIENTTNETYHDVLIVVEFTDITGKKKWEKKSGVKIDTLAPRSKQNFLILTDQFARYEIKSVTYTK